MSDPEGPSGNNAPAFTVSELSQSLKRTVEDSFGHVRVRGELSGVKRAASGHVYLALKDDQSVLDGVCWRGTANRLPFRPEDGLEVICTGKLTTYAGRSKYQIVIERMEPAGVGALMALLEERKKALAAEGLFAPERKKPIPFLPQTIGVVTSPTGSVIRDILHRLSDRFPRHVVIWPVAVQGEGAADQIAAAIRGFDRVGGDAVPRPDVLIVARGGGSIEDLWSFNEETVARAVAECSIPVISAVGHETDTTLIDYVSDRRAPTPTGAAEMAVPVREDLIATLADYDKRLALTHARVIEARRERLTALARALPRPDVLMGLKAQRLDDVSDRLPRSLSILVRESHSALARAAAGVRPVHLSRLAATGEDRVTQLDRRLQGAARQRVEGLSDQLQNLGRMIESLSYQRVLERGYVLVATQDGTPVTRADGLSAGTSVDLTFADGVRQAVVDAGSGDVGALATKKARSPTKKRANPSSPPEQGQLL